MFYTYVSIPSVVDKIFLTRPIGEFISVRSLSVRVKLIEPDHPHNCLYVLHIEIHARNTYDLNLPSRTSQYTEGISTSVARNSLSSSTDMSFRLALCAALSSTLTSCNNSYFLYILYNIMRPITTTTNNSKSIVLSLPIHKFLAQYDAV